MFRYGWLAFLIVTLVGVSVGCTLTPLETRPIADIAVATVNPEATITPTLTIIPPSSATVIPTIAPTATLLPLPSAWSHYTYYHSDSAPEISIDYPAGWDIEVNDYQDPNELLWAEFHPPQDHLEGGLSFKIYRFESLFHPFGSPDQGTCPIAWHRRLSIPDAEGFMVLTCPDSNFTELLSYYYSEKYKLQISISMPSYTVEATILQSPSITDTITQEYGVYEHMVESVRLIEP